MKGMDPGSRNPRVHGYCEEISLRGRPGAVTFHVTQKEKDARTPHGLKTQTPAPWQDTQALPGLLSVTVLGSFLSPSLSVLSSADSLLLFSASPKISHVPSASYPVSQAL